DHTPLLSTVHELTPCRPYWRCYFPNTSAIIYVIDSSDHSRLGTSRSELLTMLSEDELGGVPLLVFCNKQDCRWRADAGKNQRTIGTCGCGDRETVECARQLCDEG
ncbi:ADP-ribosylation factor family-domain-containing protein, partial [Lanmaoa asiatica]